MPIEAALSEVAQPSAQVALFVFAHQDDEFGVFPWIEREVRRGAAVVCVYLTDGGLGGQDVSVRNQESLRVLADLGVSSSSVLFAGGAGGIPDGALLTHLNAAWSCLLRALEGRQLGRMYLPAWEGGHQDHDAAHLLGVRLAQLHGVLSEARQYSLYNGGGLAGPLFRVLSPLAENGQTEDLHLCLRERLRYLTWMLRYPSQWKSWLGLFGPVALKLLCDGRYRLQPVLAERINRRPHSGRLLYERRTSLSFDEFSRQTMDFRSRFAEANEDELRAGS